MSDIHLGHRTTLTHEILANLRRAFTPALFAEIDVFVIVGDLYDRLLDQAQEESREIDRWLLEILLMAKQFDVMLWVDEGTPFHDRKQCKRIVTLNEASKINANVTYFDKITVHYEPRFDRHFFFIPDEATESAEETLYTLRQEMAKAGVEKVDAGFMHGAFRYQLPEVAGGQKHDEASYIALVNHFISIGHVHERSNYECIYAQGSFDRLNHGTEMPKGYLRFTVYEDGNHEVQFVDNAHAKRYDTYVIETQDVEETLLIVDRNTETLPEDSYIRIRVDEAHPLLKTPEVIKRRYPGLCSTIEAKKKKAKKDAVEFKAKFTPIPIHAGNIQKLILDQLVQRAGMSDEYMQIARTQLARQE